MYFTVVGRGPINTFSRFRAFPTAEFKEVVRPNFDTLYSSGWMDLTKERWSSLFQTRRVATICCRCWTCGLMFSLFPASVRRVQAPPTSRVLGRTQTNSPKDYAAVNKIQDGYIITPLSQWGNAPQPVKAVIDPSVDMKTP